MLAVLNHRPASEPALEAKKTNGNGNNKSYDEKEQRFSDSKDEQEAAQHDQIGNADKDNIDNELQSR